MNCQITFNCTCPEEIISIMQNLTVLSNKKLEDENKLLKQQYEKLNNDYKSLLSDHTKIIKNHEKIIKDYEEIIEQKWESHAYPAHKSLTYKQLETDYKILLSQYNELIRNHEELIKQKTTNNETNEHEPTNNILERNESHTENNHQEETNPTPNRGHREETNPTINNKTYNIKKKHPIWADENVQVKVNSHNGIHQTTTKNGVTQVTSSYKRYLNYKPATNLFEYWELGGTNNDYKRDLKNKNITVYTK